MTAKARQTPSKSSTVKDGSTTRYLDGIEYAERTCWRKEDHEEHTWVSYSLPSAFEPRDRHNKDRPGTNGSKHNAWCDGDPSHRPEVTSSKSYTQKKDYSEDPEFPTSDPITVTQARKIAYHMHRNQKDKSGEPYRLHLNAVEKGVVMFGGTDEERIAALFHDAVEDHHTTYDLLRKINLTEHTIAVIEAVSKRPSEIQNDYLNRVVEQGPSAMRVKLADLIHNTRHDRLEALSEYTRNRLLKKYRPSIARLMLELGIIASTDTQAELATKPVGSSGGSYWSSTGTPKKSSGSKSGTHKPDPVKYAGASLIAGDWPTDAPAPIIVTDKSSSTKVTVTLANGEVLTYDRKKSYPAWSDAAWRRMDAEDFPERLGVTEEDLIAYHDAIEEAGWE